MEETRREGGERRKGMGREEGERRKGRDEGEREEAG